MTQETSTTEEESFTEFVESRHSDNREIAVLVEGDLGNEPPLGNSAALRAAQLLNDGEGQIARIEPDNATDDDPDDTDVIVVTLPPDPDPEQWGRLRVRMTTRIPRGVDIVVLIDTTDVPWFLKHLADVRVQATEIDAPLTVTRLEFNPYNGEVYEREMTADFGENDNE